jgi:hypothetical protein
MIGKDMLRPSVAAADLFDGALVPARVPALDLDQRRLTILLQSTEVYPQVPGGLAP